jgi:hypothetical protein
MEGEEKNFNNKREAESAKIQARSFLENSYKYFLEFAVILCCRDNYRLIVIHERKPLTDNRYRTFKAAKIAFLKLYQDRAWKRQVKPEWSEFHEFEEKITMKTFYQRMAEQ